MSLIVVSSEKMLALTEQINESRQLFEQAVAERDQLRSDLAAARALLRDCLPELDGDGTTIHRVWAALSEDKP